MSIAGTPISSESLSGSDNGINTVWDILDTAVGVTLSNGNLTATASGASGGADTGVRAVDPQSTGKLYFEISCTTFTGSDTSVGISAQGWDWGNIGATALGALVVYANGNIWFNGTSQSITIGTPAGNIVCIAIDFGNNAGWIRTNNGNWNNNGTANPATNTGGINISALSGQAFCPCVSFTNNVAGAVTANFGSSGGFTFAVPAGFTSGWPTNIVTTGARLSGAAGVTILNNAWTASNTNIGSYGDQFVLSTGAITSGKWFFEVYANYPNGNDSSVGIAQANTFTSSNVYSANNAAVLFSGGSPFVNAVSQGSNIMPIRHGGIVGIAIDLTDNEIWFRQTGGNNWNNSGTANPTTNVGGYSISGLTNPFLIVLSVTNNTTAQWSVNTSSVSKTAAPSGYTIGFPATGVTPPNFLATGQIVEVMTTNPSTLEIGGQELEVLFQSSPYTQVGSVEMEVIRTQVPSMNASAVIVEVLRQSTNIDIGVFSYRHRKPLVIR